MVVEMNIRTMKRRIMKARMKKQGFRKINKHFSDHWHPERKAE